MCTKEKSTVARHRNGSGIGDNPSVSNTYKTMSPNMPTHYDQPPMGPHKQILSGLKHYMHLKANTKRTPLISEYEIK